MIIDRCPHCGASHVQTAQRYQEHLGADAATPLWRVLRCQNPECQHLVLAVLSAQGDIIERMFPAGQHELPSVDEISAEIRADYREAGLCLDSGCYKASLVMSRRVLQRCLRQQGCEQKRLVDAIGHAVKEGILRSALHALANEIREYGNLGAHPDDDQLTNASKESATQVLEFARLLIHEFFEIPASAAALQKKRDPATD